jgi:hypothetical protein
MARQKSYYELLRHPNWQRKRLEIMEREQFACQRCESTTKTLNVHHTYYEKGCKPWEYPDESLMCLCEDCHEKITGLMTKIHRELGRLSWGQIEQVYGYLQGIQLYNEENPTLDCPTLDCADGVADALEIEHYHVAKLIQDRDYSYKAILKLQHMAFQDVMDQLR